MGWSLQDMLGLGFTVEPEQAWMLEQHKGHAMGIWLPPDPEHETQCTEGCNYPILLENDELLVVPVPLRYDSGEIWVEDEADQMFGDSLEEYPTKVMQVMGPYHGNQFNWQPYRMWDIWPVTSVEYEYLQVSLERTFDHMAMLDHVLLAEFEFGDYSVWDEIAARDLVDLDILEKYEELGLEGERIDYLTGVEEKFMDELGSSLGYAQSTYWNVEGVDKLLDLGQMPGLDDAWRRLRRSSKHSWRLARDCIPPDQRGLWWNSQKWINPWP